MATGNMTPAPSAKEEILALAKANNITYHKTALDDIGNTITRLSGDEVQLDEPELLLLALKRAGVIANGEADRLHISYMRQRSL